MLPPILPCEFTPATGSSSPEANTQSLFSHSHYHIHASHSFTLNMHQNKPLLPQLRNLTGPQSRISEHSQAPISQISSFLSRHTQWFLSDCYQSFASQGLPWHFVPLCAHKRQTKGNRKSPVTALINKVIINAKPVTD